MKKENGFTLIELLAVIVILGVLLTLTVPSVLYITKLIKNKMYETKVELIEKAAQLYGQDNADDISEDGQIFKIGYLAQENYISYDNDEKQVLDPRNNRDMKCDEVIIIVKNTNSGKKINAKVTIVERDTDEFNEIAPECDIES